MTTIKEIAQKSGYSPATVSRLLNNDPNLSITADTKNKILEILNKNIESLDGQRLGQQATNLLRVTINPLVMV